MPITDRPIEPRRASLFRSGVTARLLLAAGLSGLVWLAVAWALAA